jgi:hypothetical protein
MRNIGSRPELFVDDWLIDAMEDLCFRLHSPERRDIALRIDQPWEKLWMEDPASYGATPLGYSSVMKDGDLYRLYYSWDRGGKPCLTGYAESMDGIHWSKPELGIVECRGSKANNLIWEEDRFYDFTPFVDANPEAGPGERYKTIVGGPPFALASADGIHWRKLRERPVLTDGAFDSQNVAFWDSQQNRYVAYYRDFIQVSTGERVRAIKRATSTNFLDWTAGQFLDYGTAPLEHFYTNGIVPYFRAPHLYLGFPMRFVPERKAVERHVYPGVSDAVFMTSRDGTHWDRRFMEAFIRPGLELENWTERNFLMAWGIVPTGPADMSLYWVEHYRHPSNKIVRGTLRTDGFVSLHAGYGGGLAVTHPLTFEGNRLVLNFSTSAVGSVRVEVLQADGRPVPGLSGEASPAFFGDNIAGECRWSSDARIGDLAGQAVRLKLHLKDADLFAIQFKL